jgi:molybdate transport system substrate-binding protein
VARGAPKPDIGSESSVRAAVACARRVGYSSGPSGEHVRALLARWDASGSLAARALQAPPGVPVGSLVAAGEVDLGFQQWSELMDLPGIEIVGRLPADIRKTTVFTAAVCTASTQPDATRRLLSFLVSDAVASAKRRHGMEPASRGP